MLRRLQGDVDLANINGANFSDAERETILAAVEDETVWRRLPLHIDTEGTIGCVDADCFRDTGRAARAELADGCRFIRRAHDLEHQENQERWIPIWTSETTVRRALGSEDPQRYWRVIVDEIGNLSPGSRDDFTKLRSVQWLPLAGGGVISPEDVIDIGDMASEVDRLSSCCGYPFAGIGGLHQDVKAHTEFDTLRPLFSTGIEGLACLGQLMAEVPGYRVGSIGRIGNDELLIVAESLSNLPTLPAWAIVAKAIQVFDAATVGDQLLDEVSKPLKGSDIMTTLREISNLGTGQNHLLPFNLYLRQFAQAGTECMDDIRHLRLLSNAGSLRIPHQTGQ